MKVFRTRYMALLLSAAAIAAAGCGSSSKSKTTAAPPATPSTPSTSSTGTTTTAGGFSAQVEALCQQAKKAAAPAGTDLPKFAAAVEPYIAKFEALMPPAAQKAEYDKFVANAKDVVAAAKKNDMAAYNKAQMEGQGLGAKLGAPGCDA